MASFMDRVRGNGNEQQVLAAVKQVAQESHTTEFTAAQIFEKVGFTDQAAFQQLIDKRLLKPVDGKAGVYHLSMLGLR